MHGYLKYGLPAGEATRQNDSQNDRIWIRIRLWDPDLHRREKPDSDLLGSDAIRIFKRTKKRVPILRLQRRWPKIFAAYDKGEN